MSEIISTIDRLAPAILESLINTTFVGLVVTLIVFLICRTSTRLNAATRHGLWWVTLGLVVALPLVGLIHGPSKAPIDSDRNSGSVAPAAPLGSLASTSIERSAGPRAERQQTTHATNRPPRTEPLPRQSRTETTRRVSLPHASASSSTVATRPPVASATRQNQPGVLHNVRGTMAGAIDWASGAAAELRWTPFLISPGGVAGVVLLLVGAIAALLMVRLVLGYRRLVAIKRRSLPLPVGLEHRLLASLPERRRRRIAIRQADDLPVPTVLGLTRPVILFPSELLDALTDNELENILMHEYAHVCRWDDWTNLVQRIIAALFFYHPGVRLISAQLCLQREIACDDWVIAQTGRTRAYATCLTKLVSLTPWSRPYAPAPGALKSKSQFARRIESLLDKSRNASPRTSRLAFLTAAVMLSIITMQMTKVPPVVAVFDPVEALLRGAAPVVAEALPRHGLTRAPVAIMPVGCDEVVHDCNRRLFDGESSPAAPRTATVRPANAVTYVPRPDRCECCDGICEHCGAHGNVREDCCNADNVTSSFTKYFDWGVENLFGAWNTGTTTYLIQYRHGTSEQVTESDLRRMLSMGITGEYVREVRQAGLENVTIEDLKALKSSGIDGDYIEELTQAGLKYLTVEDVIRLRRNGVDAEDVEAMSIHPDAPLSVDDVLELRQRGVSSTYARAVSGIGQALLSIDDIVALRNHGVSPDYIDDLQNSCSESFDIDDIIKLRDHGVSSDFVAAVTTYALSRIDVDEIVTLRSHGVSEDYLAGLNSVGLGSGTVSVDDIISLRSNGVDPGFAGKVVSRWGSSASIHDVITLRTNGVSTDYLDELGTVNLEWLSPDDVVALRSNGVSANLIAAIVDYGFDQTIDVGDIIALRANGVSDDYLADFRELSRTFSVDDLISLRNNGVDAGFVAELARLKLDKLSAQDIIELRVLGVSPRVIDDSRRSDDWSY